MSIAEFEKAIEAAVEKSIAEDVKERDDATTATTSEATATDETGDSEAEDGSQRSEGDETGVEAEPEAEADSGEGDAAGETGKVDPGQTSVEKEAAPFLSFKNQDEFLAFMQKMAKQEPAKEEAQTQEEDVLANLPALDPEVYGEGFIKAFDTMKSVIAKQQEAIKGFKQQYETLNQSVQHNTREDIEKRFDAQVAALGEDFHDALGAGRMAELPPDSSQYQKRDMIAAKMAVLSAGYRSVGQDVPAFDALFQEAANSVLASDMKSIEKGKLEANLKKREKGHIQRPGGSKQKHKMTPEDEVTALLRERYGDKFSDTW